MSKKSKLPKRNFEFVLPIYEQTVIVSFSPEDFIKTMEHFCIPDEYWQDSVNACGACQEFKNDNGARFYAVYVNVPRCKQVSLNSDTFAEQTLIHELAHTTFFVMDRLGLNNSDENHENFCYMQDFMYGIIKPHLVKELQRDQS